ncbi:hypothetical protein ACS0TY_011409 [Phlomoides rotata]
MSLLSISISISFERKLEITSIVIGNGSTTHVQSLLQVMDKYIHIHATPRRELNFDEVDKEKEFQNVDEKELEN